MFEPHARRFLAENLRIIRLLRNWSQDELATCTGLDRSYLGGIERGERNVGLDNLDKMARGLRMSVENLLRQPDLHRLAQDLLDTCRTGGAPTSGFRESSELASGKWPSLEEEIKN